MVKRRYDVDEYPELSSLPATPTVNWIRHYYKTDKKLYLKGSDGIERPFWVGQGTELINGAKARYASLQDSSDPELNALILKGVPWNPQDYGEGNLFECLNDSNGSVQENVNIAGSITGATNATPIVITVPSRSIGSTTVSGSSTITAPGSFTQEDVGASISDGAIRIPGGTTIIAVAVGGSTATMSANALSSGSTTAIVADHGLTTGDVARIHGVGGNTAVNGGATSVKFWKVTRINRTTFSLDTSVGNGAYTSGGLMYCNKSPVLTRIDGNGQWGGPMMHVGIGLRGVSGVVLAQTSLAAIWLQHAKDSGGILIQDAYASQWPETTVGRFFAAQSVRGPSALARYLWQIEATGTETLQPSEGRTGTDKIWRIRNDADSADVASWDVNGKLEALSDIVSRVGTGAEVRLRNFLGFPAVQLGSDATSVLAQLAPGVISFIGCPELQEQAAPSTPNNGNLRVFADSADSEPKVINDAGKIFGLAALRQLVFQIDGGGVAPITGSRPNAPLIIPFDGVIERWRVMSDVSGSCVLDLWKDTYANFPPTNADSITGTDKPTLSSAQKAESTALTGWTTSVVAGDVMYLEVESASTLTAITLVLWVRPT